MSDQIARTEPSPLGGFRHLAVACARCGGVVAELALLPAGYKVEDDVLSDTLVDRDRLRRSGFMGTVTAMWSVESLIDLFEAVARGDFPAAERIDSDMVGFYCNTCGAAYCQRCWTIGPPVFDEDMPDFYDCTYGVCPNGHRHIVDD